jgi:hypothetical protein
MRLHHEPTDAEVAELNGRFADLLVDGVIARAEPLPGEISDRDHLELPRLLMHYEPRKAGRLRALINAVNTLPSAGV